MHGKLQKAMSGERMQSPEDHLENEVKVAAAIAILVVNIIITLAAIR